MPRQKLDERYQGEAVVCGTAVDLTVELTQLDLDYRFGSSDDSGPSADETTQVETLITDAVRAVVSQYHDYFGIRADESDPMEAMRLRKATTAAAAMRQVANEGLAQAREQLAAFQDVADVPAEPAANVALARGYAQRSVDRYEGILAGLDSLDEEHLVVRYGY